jgi:hypothetical protein
MTCTADPHPIGKIASIFLINIVEIKRGFFMADFTGLGFEFISSHICMNGKFSHFVPAPLWVFLSAF